MGSKFWFQNTREKALSNFWTRFKLTIAMLHFFLKHPVWFLFAEGYKHCCDKVGYWWYMHPSLTLSACVQNWVGWKSQKQSCMTPFLPSHHCASYIWAVNTQGGNKKIIKSCISSTANTICVAQGGEIKTNCKSGCSAYQILCCKARDYHSAAQAFTICCGPVKKALNKHKRNLRGERGQPGWQWPSL